MKFASAAFALTAIVGSANMAHASVTLTGVALLGVPGVVAGDTAVFLADYNNQGFLSLNVPFFAPLAEDSTYGNFRVLGVKTARSSLGTVSVSGSLTNIPYDDQLGAGDAFAVLVFSYSTTSTIPNDSYTIWTDASWVLPTDGAAVSFTSSSTLASYKQFRATDSPFRVAQVQDNTLDTPLPMMPEPVSFSAFAGGLGLAFAGSRRRRRV